MRGEHGVRVLERERELEWSVLGDSVLRGNSQEV
jgi:hypothetical protein